MIFYTLVFLNLLYTCILGNNNSNSSLNRSNDLKTLTLSSEGGSIIQDSPFQTQFQHKKGKVVPRKGAPNDTDSTELLYNNISANITKENFTMPRLTSDDIITQNNVSSNPLIATKTENTTIINTSKEMGFTKPDHLNYQALENMDNIIKHRPLSSMKPSLETVSDHMLSPNKDNIVNSKSITHISPSDINGHPSMVMPLVIAILMVPMFAVLGYLALKHGKEAWKNRHYKRMDFLLDGMYND